MGCISELFTAWLGAAVQLVCSLLFRKSQCTVFQLEDQEDLLLAEITEAAYESAGNGQQQIRARGGQQCAAVTRSMGS